jgi:predicted phage baseplate assembly protein
LGQRPLDALPAITLLEHPPEHSLGGATGEDEARLRVWTPQRDLMHSSRFAREFKVEVDDDGSAFLLFGDGKLGKRPAAGTLFTAQYRIGNGTPGNVGHETITHIVSNDDGIVGVRNPLPAQGGTALESTGEARMYAPQSLYTQERCVTEDDYVAMAERHPQVQKAAAVVRWTGSWHTVYILVDRYEGRPVDEGFRHSFGSYLGRYRMSGYDLDIRPPYFVPLDIGLTVFVEPGYFRTAVRQTLIEVFSNTTLPDDQRGFFHPDNLTFGQNVYQSQVVTRAAQVSGVMRVDLTRFARWGEPSSGVGIAEEIKVRPFEVARLDNDPGAPWNGIIRFNVVGGW